MTKINIDNLITTIKEEFKVEPILKEDDDWTAGYLDGKETMLEYIINFLEEYKE